MAQKECGCALYAARWGCYKEARAGLTVAAAISQKLKEVRPQSTST